jgi:CheY-like chemotaxis protein
MFEDRRFMPSGELKVLVVDDHSTALADAMRRWGYRSLAAKTLAEMLAIVSREQPHAVLLDARIPEFRISTLDELRKRSPRLVIIIISHKEAFEAGVRDSYRFITKPIDQTQLRSMLDEALRNVRPRTPDLNAFRDENRPRTGEAKRGRPQRQPRGPLGNLVLTAMQRLGLNYKNIVAESERLVRLNNNADMRIGKSTLGNIISGSIRQPGTAKLDSLRIILNLSRDDLDAAIGLQPERRLVEQLEMSRARTREVPIDAVTRHRTVKMPILDDDAKLDDTQFLLKRWANIDVEYLGSFYPPHLSYVVIGEDDTNASPVAPPGSRVLVNRLLNEVQPAGNVSFYERELFYVLTPYGFTCVYAELAPGDKVVLIPHPSSGNLREEFKRIEVEIIGQVVGVLYPAKHFDP